jgi:ribose transport system permease protein
MSAVETIEPPLGGGARLRSLLDAAGAWQQLGLLVVVAVVWAALASSAPGFLSGFNQFALQRDVAVFVVIGFSQMVVLAIGALNLAVGAIGVVAAMLCGGLMQRAGLPPAVAVLAAVAAAGLAGGLNGWFVVRSRLNAFVVTLATSSIFSGLMLIATRAEAYRGLPDAFVDFGRTRVAGLPVLLVVTLAVTLWLVFIFRSTALGRSLLALGANPRAAELSGLPVGRLTIAAHALSGALAGVAGVMVVARLGSALPSIGSDWVLASFVAPVIGGTLLAGGAVSVVGTLLGAVLVVSITNGLNLLQVSNFWVQLFQGLVLLVAVVFDRWRSVRSERRRAAL